MTTAEDLERRIAAAAAGVTANNERAQEAARVCSEAARVTYRAAARECAADVARLVAMRSPETVTRMEMERGLR